MLIEKGVNPDIQLDGATALMRVASLGQISFVRLMLDKGANLSWMSQGEKILNDPEMADVSAEIKKLIRSKMKN